MKKLLAYIFLSSMVLASYAQDRAVTYQVRHNRDGSQTVFYHKQKPGQYTMVIYFTELANQDLPNPIIHTVKDGRDTDTVNFGPSKNGVKVTYKGRKLWTVPGPVDILPDTSFVYRLPCEEDKTCMTVALVRPERSPGGTGYQFLMGRGETVSAVRGGTVIAVADRLDLQNEPFGNYFSNARNRITIQHDDGTLTEYSLLEHKSFLVSEGQRVESGTPLARAGTLDGEISQTRIMFFYYSLDPSKKFDPDKGTSSVIGTLPLYPYFGTHKGAVKPGDWTEYAHIPGLDNFRFLLDIQQGRFFIKE